MNPLPYNGINPLILSINFATVNNEGPPNIEESIINRNSIPFQGVSTSVGHNPHGKNIKSKIFMDFQLS